MPSTIDTLILGSGPTGLGAAYRLRELGQNNFLILERSSQVGGLATSYKDERGFTWDVGGHVQFSHYPYFDRVMNEALGSDGWLHHERESWVWMHNRFVPYPFQNNIHRLPEKIRDECFNELLATQSNPLSTLKNFEDWIIQTFGKGIHRHFMAPYNFKVWAYELSEMNYRWVGERVSVIDTKRIEENIRLNRDDVSWGPNNTFHFPKKGGTGAIWEGVANLVGRQQIRLRCNVVSIDPLKKIAKLQSGEEVFFKRLFSTMPLDRLCQIIQGLPENITAQAKELKYSSTHVVGIGLKGQPRPELATKCWMYFPEDNCPFYRVTVFSNYSPNNVPEGGPYFSLMTEISESHKKPVNQSTLVDEVIEGLRATKLISNEEIVSRWSFRTEYGYPTPSLKRDEILKTVIPVLDAQNIFSRGRFGGWKYEVSNQDHSFMQGVEWVDKIIEAKPERTFQL